MRGVTPKNILKKKGCRASGSVFFKEKNKFKESVLTINLTVFQYEKSMLYGCVTLGKLSKSLGKLELVVKLRWFDDKVFQNLSQIEHFSLVLLDFHSLI